jgi:hypothetical protein
MALLNQNTVILSIDLFAIITPIFSFSLFLPPSIISVLGYARANTNLLTLTPEYGRILGHAPCHLTIMKTNKIQATRGFHAKPGLLLPLESYIM